MVAENRASNGEDSLDSRFETFKQQVLSLVDNGASNMGGGSFRFSDSSLGKRQGPGSNRPERLQPPFPEAYQYQGCINCGARDHKIQKCKKECKTPCVRCRTGDKHFFNDCPQQQQKKVKFSDDSAKTGTVG